MQAVKSKYTFFTMMDNNFNEQKKEQKIIKSGVSTLIILKCVEQNAIFQMTDFCSEVFLLNPQKDFFGKVQVLPEGRKEGTAFPTRWTGK